MCRTPSSGAPAAPNSAGSKSSSSFCGTAQIQPSAAISVPSASAAPANRPPLTRISRTFPRIRTSPPLRTTASRQPSYKSANGTSGMPTWYPVLLPRNAFQKTSIPYRASVCANSSSSALTSTTRQNLSIALRVCFIRCSQASIETPSIFGGFPPAVAITIIALAMPHLSVSDSASKNKNDGIMCSGGGSGAAAIVERFPAASTKNNLS